MDLSINRFYADTRQIVKKRAVSDGFDLPPIGQVLAAQSVLRVLVSCVERAWPRQRSVVGQL